MFTKWPLWLPLTVFEMKILTELNFSPTKLYALSSEYLRLWTFSFISLSSGNSTTSCGLASIAAGGEVCSRSSNLHTKIQRLFFFLKIRPSPKNSTLMTSSLFIGVTNPVSKAPANFPTLIWWSEDFVSSFRVFQAIFDTPTILKREYRLEMLTTYIGITSPSIFCHVFALICLSVF